MREATTLIQSAVLLIGALGVTTDAFCESVRPDALFEVKAFGAVGDGVAKDTVSIQKAIETCADGGGGTVYFAPGTYLSGSLHLRSGVTFWIDSGATIMGSPDDADYDPYEELGFENDSDRETSYFHFALIWGEDVERIAIIGQGTIDGNRTKRGGPKPIALKRCRYVDIKGITILNAPNYCISMLGTDYVNIDGVSIRNAYCDGIDPDSCRNVRIANCHIESWDDAIVPKASFSLGERRSVENVTVTSCFLATACNAFKLGTESAGDFKRIAVSNCVMSGLEGHRPATSGIALESVDGSNVDGVVVSNITMVDVRSPIFIRLGNRGRDMETPVPGTLKNVTIDNVVATNASLASSVTGIPGHNVEGVTLSNIRITYQGGGPYRPSDEAVPEAVDSYPDPRIFDGLPAYGMYCRHVKDLTLSNVQLFFDDGYWRLDTGRSKDIQWVTDNGVPQPSVTGRPGHALVCDDVTALRIDGFRATPSTGDDSVMRLVNVRDALVQGCMAVPGTQTFAEVSGAQTARVRLTANNLMAARKAVSITDANPREVLREPATHD